MRHTLRRTTWATLVLAVWCVAPRSVTGQIPPFGGAPAYVSDVAARRAKTMATLGSDSVLVLWSAPSRVYSGDTNYEYRQESNLLYLSGISQEQTILVLVPGARSQKEWLFVRRADPTRDLWYGRTLPSSEAAAASGIANVLPQQGTEVFQAFLTALLSGRAYQQSQEAADEEFGSFFDAVRRGQAKLAVLAPLSSQDADVGLGRDAEPQVAWVREMEAKHPGVKGVSVGRALLAQRQIKTAYEQRVLTRSVEISAEAHVEGMRATRPGRWEYEIEAAIERWFLTNGMLSIGYPSIVGSGPNATTLHYLASTRHMQRGDLLLVDAAGSFQGLTGDITRTYPVSGKFSPEQRAIYDLVLSAQEAGIAAARPGGAVKDVDEAVRAVLANGLTKLGLVRATSGPERDAEVSLWCPHGPTHGIGMDVHESIETLNPGTAFVIEPGVYVRSDAFDRLVKTPATAAFIEAVKPVAEKYRDLGVRIEDSFLMTSTGPVMLSAKAPRRAIEIEKVVGRGR